MALRLLGATGVLGLEPTAGVHALVRVEWMPEGARYQGTVPEVVWAKRSCRNRVRHDRMVKKHLTSFIVWTSVDLKFCVTAAHGSPRRM